METTIVHWGYRFRVQGLNPKPLVVHRAAADPVRLLELPVFHRTEFLARSLNMRQRSLQGESSSYRSAIFWLRLQPLVYQFKKSPLKLEN